MVYKRIEVGDIDYIKIWDEVFRGIGYQGLLTVNTKTYVQSPERSNDGSIPNINDHDTFIVPRAKVNFKLFSLEDYQRLCTVVSLANEFPVTYWDKQVGDFVTHMMYVEPEEMAKLFNVGTKVIGVLDYEVSFVGTLNGLQQKTIKYYLNNPNVQEEQLLSETSYDWGRNAVIYNSTNLEELATEKGFAIPVNTFTLWNTKADGTGINYRPDMKISVFQDIKLYAQWQ